VPTLIEFLTTGGVGPIRPGASRSDVLRVFGNPGQSGEFPLMPAKAWPSARFWHYGNVEFCFADDQTIRSIKVFPTAEQNGAAAQNTKSLIPDFPEKLITTDGFVEILKKAELWKSAKACAEGSPAFILGSRVFVFEEDGYISHFFIEFDPLRHKNEGYCSTETR